MLHPVKHAGRPRPRRRSAWLLGIGCVLAVANAHAQGRFASPPEPKFSIKRFVVDGENPLSEGDTDAILAGFTGEQQGVARLQQAARTLESELKARGYGFYRVTLPPQDVVDTVTLKLIMFRVGKVEIQEQQYYSEANIRASFPSLREDESPNARNVARNLAMVNDHPGKQATVTLTESEMRDSVDVLLRVHDEKPVTWFSTLQNTGSSTTGAWRLSLGVQHANLFDRDQQFTAFYVTSPDTYAREVQQYGMNWAIPFYEWASSLSLYAMYSSVNSPAPSGASDGSFVGAGNFMGARWTYRLLPEESLSQTVSVSLDAKEYQSNVDRSEIFKAGRKLGKSDAYLTDFVDGLEAVTSDVSSLPLTLSYAGDVRQGWGKLDWGLEYSLNQPSGEDSRLAYVKNASGRDASRQWALWRASSSLAWQADSGWSLVGRIRGQYSPDPLISGEQFGLGGAQSVRGYNERELSGDSGFFTSLELWSKTYAQQLKFLVFRDYGQRTYNNKKCSSLDIFDVCQNLKRSGFFDSRSLMSIGLGTRWQPNPSIGFSLDVGYALRDGSGTHGAGTERGDWKGHALLTVRF